MAEFKEGVNRIVEGVAHVASFIGDKTAEAVDGAKVSMAISSHHAVLDRVYKSIGRHYYEQYKAGSPVDPQLLEDMKLIDVAIRQIEILQAKED